jgi:hypothetical protein
MISMYVTTVSLIVFLFLMLLTGRSDESEKKVREKPVTMAALIIVSTFLFFGLMGLLDIHLIFHREIDDCLNHCGKDGVDLFASNYNSVNDTFDCYCVRRGSPPPKPPAKEVVYK